ncbi:MAG: hypothetical protein HYS69_07700 [candidate division NC10 bacterium]|nr:hypothetical protein [candidate division NC10 bacterium]
MSTKGQQLKKVLAITLLTAAITIEGNQWANAQFNNAYPFSGFNCAQTNVIGPVTNWLRSVGVGNFSGNGAFTNSFLHVNSNYLMLPTNGSITSLGEVFRTDAPSGFNTQWRLLRGGAEMGRIFSFSTDNNFHILLPEVNCIFTILPLRIFNSLIQQHNRHLMIRNSLMVLLSALTAPLPNSASRKMPI